MACKDISLKFVRDGFDCCVLKGQGNLLNYPGHLAYRRQPGDIDLWVCPRNTNDRAKAAYPEMALWEPFFRVWHYGWRLRNKV